MMFSKKPVEPTINLVDQAAQSANDAIKSVQQDAHQALDGLAGAVQDLHDQTVPKLERVQHEASLLKQRSLEAVREAGRQVRERAERASAGTVHYVQQEPMKAMLLAAAAGAALVALATLLARSTPRR